MQVIIYVKDENFNKNHLLFTKKKTISQICHQKHNHNLPKAITFT
jgi:hypothetical protein